MYRKILVEAEIQAGQRSLEELDRAQVPVSGAFWLYAEDASEWRVVIVSPNVATKGPRMVYALVGLMLMNPSGAPIPIPMERIYLISPHDSRYEQVRMASLGGGGMRITGSLVRNVASEDAYIYRVA